MIIYSFGYYFIVFRDLVWYSGGHWRLVRHHQFLCHCCYLRLHPSPCLCLQVWTLCRSRSSRGGVCGHFFVLDSVVLFVLIFNTERIKWFIICSSAVWWVISMPVSQYSGCLTLRSDHSQGQLVLSCLERLWSIAGISKLTLTYLILILNVSVLLHIPNFCDTVQAHTKK